MSTITENGGRYALIVAVSDYRDPKLRRLRAPAADAERLAAVLKDSEIGGFAVDVTLDEDEPLLRRRIARFFSGRKPDDLLLVHFSCHGIKDEGGELYLAAADTELGDLLGATGISSAWLSEQIDRSRSKRVVVLLDCCFSGSFPLGMRARGGEQVNVHEHLEGRGRAVITASSAMEYSYEGDHISGEGQPSIFTDAVVEGLETGKADRDGDRWISVDDLYGYVYDRVKDKTPWQSPNKLSNLEGPLRIARSVYTPPIEPARLNEELVALTEHPIPSARLAAAEDLARLLSSSDPSVALAARQVLEKLATDDSRMVATRVLSVLEGQQPEIESDQPSQASVVRSEARASPVLPHTGLHDVAENESPTTEAKLEDEEKEAASSEPEAPGGRQEVTETQTALGLDTPPASQHTRPTVSRPPHSLALWERRARQNVVSVVAAGLVAVGIGSVLGNLASHHLFARPSLATATIGAFAAFAVLIAPTAVALIVFLAWSRRSDFSILLAVSFGILGLVLGSLASLIHVPAPPHPLSFVSTFMIIGAGLGLTAAALRRQARDGVMLIGAGVAGGLLGGLARDAHGLDHNDVAMLITAAPLCLAIGLMPTCRRSAASENEASGAD